MSARKRRSWLHIRLLAVFSTLMLVVIGLFFSKALKQPQVCANSISCVSDLSGAYQAGKQSIFMNHNVTEPEDLAQGYPQAKINVLGDTTTGEKHIYVDLSNQQLHAYQGNTLLFSFPISSGKWRPTPTGDFRIWIKLRFAHMEGGEGADYYNLYNVPYTMYFYNSDYPKELGYSLHGAYWHNNFGHPMSHGCVNLRPEDAEKLYAWADPQGDTSTIYADDNNPGTEVTIYGTPPED